MTYLQLAYVHLATVVPAFLIGTYLLLRRHHNVRLHRGNMLGLYFGGLIIAGGFAFAPGRLLHGWIFGN